ncbi:MAG: hypothetical protein II781_00230 [Clostridia bacterium]|nr:hypothetical protein [Clostridia bacterium]
MKRTVKVDPFFTDQPEKNFLADLTCSLHAQKPSFFSDRMPDPDEISVSGMFLASRFPEDRGLLDVSYTDFTRFLTVCGIEGNRYPVRIEKGKAGCFESYRIRVTPKETVITAGDTEGIRRALVYLEDELLRREGPCLPLGEISRSPVMKTRITRCFFSPINRPPKYGDELSDDTDYYPEEYLNRLMHDGINGVWIYTRFSDLVPVSALPEYGRGSEGRIEKLNRVIGKCARYGIRVYIFAIEPIALSEELSERFPQVDGGVSYNGNHFFCVNTPEGRSLVREAGSRLFTLCPDLGGFISITYGERPTSCSSAYASLPEINYRKEILCPRCRELPPGQILANAVEALTEGIHSVSPQAEVISWTYGHRMWPGDDIREYVHRAPEDAVLMQNFEELIYEKQLGRTRQGVDYWLSCTGPSPLFELTAKEAAENGKQMYMKTQVCCSHEVASVPYVPVPGILFDKYRAAYRLHVTGVMQCWYFGNYPSLMSKAAGELAFTHGFPDKHAFLCHLAAGFAGRSRAEALARAWEAFETGYRQTPLNIMFSYYGPMHDGPVWALHLKPRNFSLPRSWQTLDPTDGDRIGECLLSGHTLPEAVTLTGRMTRSWAEGYRLLQAAAADCPDLAEQVSVAGALDLLFRSGHNILRFYLLRERLGMEIGDPVRNLQMLRSLVLDEIRNSETLSSFCEKDGRLGYHSEGEGYKFFPKKLAWRIARLKELLASEFPETEERITQGLPPLAYYAGEETDSSVYHLGHKGINSAAWEPIGEHAAFRASCDPDTLTIEIRADHAQPIRIGAEFRLLWPAPQVILHPDGQVEVPVEDYLYFGAFGHTLKQLRRFWRVEALPADGGMALRIRLSRVKAGWTEDHPLKLYLATSDGDLWCREEDPVHTLGKSSVSPGEYGWLLP